MLEGIVENFQCFIENGFKDVRIVTIDFISVKILVETAGMGKDVEVLLDGVII
jgi:hypothetical protein